MARLDSVIDQADIVITTTGNKDIVTVESMARMKHQAINVGHFDNEIDVAGLTRYPGIIRLNIKPQVDEWRFPDGHSIILLSEGRLMNLGNATGHPSFVMSNSFSNQVIAQIELFTRHEEYNKDVYRLPKILDEKVAKIHVLALGGELMLSKDQAEQSGWTWRGRSSPSTTDNEVVSAQPCWGTRLCTHEVLGTPGRRGRVDRVRWATGTGAATGRPDCCSGTATGCYRSTARYGATTAVPGDCSAGRNSGETAEQAAGWEAAEEAGLESSSYTVVGRYVDDHGGWSYTTVIACSTGASCRTRSPPRPSRCAGSRWVGWTSCRCTRGSSHELGPGRPPPGPAPAVGSAEPLPTRRSTHGPSGESRRPGRW